ncbi:MAG: putative acyl carrier protein phosphodiesterase 1 phosphodiesterase 1 [Microbacteriaceae bacterium]|nr:putative acyl carrier protein phosphodiesterase 1 phosphodiesterase 1 [Microbacteriaceae bacterium]
MPRLLHIDSSADIEHSRSRAITRTFADEWRSHGADFTVTYRDLHRVAIPHLPDAALHWPPRLRPQGATPPAEAEALQQELILELVSADVLLVGAPMYNYSLPSALKAWIDYVHVPGVTAPFDVETQPLAGRPAVIVTSRGASYEEGSPTAGWDHAVPVLELILGNALGMSTTVIATSLTLADSVPALADRLDQSRAELAQAHREAAAKARRLAL